MRQSHHVSPPGHAFALSKFQLVVYTTNLVVSSRAAGAACVRHRYQASAASCSVETANPILASNEARLIRVKPPTRRQGSRAATTKKGCHGPARCSRVPGHPDHARVCARMIPYLLSHSCDSGDSSNISPVAHGAYSNICPREPPPFATTLRSSPAGFSRDRRAARQWRPVQPT